MLWIGITGPIGGGKSSVSEIFRTMGYPVLDADALARQVLSMGGPGEAEAVRTFGREILDSSGRLDRRALGRKVFGDPTKLLELEKIVHPRIRAQVTSERARLAAAGHKVAFYDVPLLFEKKMERDFDRVIVVIAPLELRQARLKARSGLSDEEIAERESRQVPAQEKESRAHFVIRNDGEPSRLREEVVRAIRKLKLPSPPVT